MCLLEGCFLSEDIETNLGPRLNLNNHFTICHWNLNTISTHNFTEIQFLIDKLLVDKFDTVCLFGTYLNPIFPLDDDSLDIPDYIMVRADPPASNKRGGGCMYYKNCLPLKLVSDFDLIKIF